MLRVAGGAIICGLLVESAGLYVVNRLDVGGTFAWTGDLFPSQHIYGTDYFGDPYEVDRFSEHVGFFGQPELIVDNWSSLQGQLQLR